MTIFEMHFDCVVCGVCSKAMTAKKLQEHSRCHDLESQLTQAREEIESYKECVNGHKNPKWTCVSCGSETMEALKAKLSKLERVRAAQKDLIEAQSSLLACTQDDFDTSDGDGYVLQEMVKEKTKALAAMRETEER